MVPKKDSDSVVRSAALTIPGLEKSKAAVLNAAEAITEYIQAAGIDSGPLFRPLRSRRGNALSSRRMNQRSMYRVLMSYLERLPGATQEKVAGWGKGPGVHLLAAFPAGDDGNVAAGHQRAHRVRAGAARPQTHHHHTDL
jgi:hypothetical protein